MTDAVLVGGTPPSCSVYWIVSRGTAVGRAARCGSPRGFADAVVSFAPPDHSKSAHGMPRPSRRELAELCSSLPSFCLCAAQTVSLPDLVEPLLAIISCGVLVGSLQRARCRSRGTRIKHRCCPRGTLFETRERGHTDSGWKWTFLLHVPRRALGRLRG